MKTLTAIILIGYLLSGCNTNNGSKTNSIQSKTFFKIYCDKETNVEYIIKNGLKSSAITPRYLLDGSLKSCEKGTQNENFSK